MTRRRLLAGLGLAPMTVTVRDDKGQHPERWLVKACPGCGLDVCFLLSQARNQCGQCGRAVMRRGVE